MKNRSILLLPLLAVAVVSTTGLRAATLYWDGTDTGPDADGGAGNWEPTTTNWDDFSIAGFDAAWPALTTGDDDAIFGGVAGTVTIDFAGITANDLTFATTNYTVSGGVLTLNSLDPDGPDPLPAPAPVITNAATATISASLVGTAGLTKYGNGTLVLSGSNSGLGGPLTVTGATSGNNGGINFNGSAAIGAFSLIDVQNNSFVNLLGAAVPATIPLKIAGGGGTGAPQGAIKGGSGISAVEGPVSIENAAVRVGNLGTSLTFNGPVTAAAASGFGLLIRVAGNQGVIFTNSGNSWEGLTTLGEGSVYFHPGTLPTTTNLILAGSGNTWLETNGSMNREIGVAANQIQFNATAGRINGLSARGGDLTVNFGGAAAPLVWGVTPSFNPGALGLAGANATGTLTLQNPIDLNAGTRIIDVANGTAAVDARITAALTNGQLSKTGNGVLALAAANSFTTTMVFGASSADRGALRLEHNQALAGITLVDMNAAVNSAARARIELTGGITITGTDIRTGGHGDQGNTGAVLANLAGDNTWGGVIRISNTGGSYGIRSDAGTLTLSGTLQNGIGSNRDWNIGGEGNITISGNVVNGGASGLSLTKFGSGTLKLTGSNNTYSLGTTIALGTVQVGDGGTTGSLGTGPVANNSALVFDRTGTLAVPGNLSGSGTLTKRGDGAVTLAGATIAHSGATAIDDGALIITGNATGATGPLTVGDGIGAAGSAILGGTGPLGASVTVAGDGVIAPGTSAGTLTVLGTVAGTGALAIELDGAAADRLVVAGSLDISALKLQLTTLAAPTQPVYVIVDAAGAITGAAFAAISGTVPAGYELVYGYDDGTDAFNIALVRNATPYQTWAGVTHGLSGEAALPGADPDHDGLDNATEFVLGTEPNPANPGANSAAAVPQVAVTADRLVFTYRRADLALTEPGISIQAEYGSDLTGWTPAVAAPGGITITVTDDGYGAGVDRVEVAIPRALGVGPGMFARLKVTVP